MGVRIRAGLTIEHTMAKFRQTMVFYVAIATSIDLIGWMKLAGFHYY